MGTLSRPWVLGIAASHNGGVCLLHGDQLVVAVQEERLTRHKRARVVGSQRCLAVDYCLQAAGIDFGMIDAVGFTSPLSFADPTNDMTANPDWPRLSKVPLLRVSHHRAHAIAAVATSGFADCAVLIIDGAGSPETDLDDIDRSTLVGPGAFETVSIYGYDGTLHTVRKHLGSWITPRQTGMPTFGSLGGMFSAVSQQIFGDASEAGKVMGLAPYGVPTIPSSDFVEFDGTQLAFPTTVPDRFRHDQRWPGARHEYQDLAASVQHALDLTVTSLAVAARHLTGHTRLAYAGGVALNCTTNELLVDLLGADRFSVMAAAEDNGTAIGAAYAALWTLTDHSSPRRLRSDSAGRTYRDDDIVQAIAAFPFFEQRRSDDVAGETADLLAGGAFVGWFQEGSEFGPRALGHRSILADPRPRDAKDRLNAQVKRREAFRPFAPVVTAEQAPNWFEGGAIDSPFMLRACKWRPSLTDLVPAVVHVDGTGRVQTVDRDVEPGLWRLLDAFSARTGVGVLLNTSLNIAGYPIVETPLDALLCMLAGGLRVAVMGDHIVERTEPSSSSPDPSTFTIAPNFSTIDQCRVDSDHRHGPVVVPAELGLRTPAALGARPEELIGRLPTAIPWTSVRYSVAHTATPWGTLSQVLDPVEGAVLSRLPAGGVTAGHLVGELAALHTSHAAAEDRLWHLVATHILQVGRAL
jgi:carbamoyltransferase